jgi:regulatory protein
MESITAITASPRQPGRFVIEVDGRELATVAIDTIDRLHLAVGRPIAPVAEALERDAAALKTYDRALNMLAARARSSSDLRRQLTRKGEPPEQVNAAIARLQQAGFLDDAGFARQFARSKIAGPGFAKRRLEQELYRRGVARDVASEAIAEVLDDDSVDAAGTIERLARKKMRSLAKLDPAGRSRRLYAFLARRGYDSEEIKRAIKSVEAADAELLDEMP